MQFSMKWVLLGMAYVAVAAAAFSQGLWVYADLLWCATFLVICYAMLTAALSSGVRRAGAAGFALFALALAMCTQFADDTVPTRRILLAAGVQENPTVYPTAMYGSTANWTLMTTTSGYSSAVQPPTASVPASGVSGGFANAPAPTLSFTPAPVELPFTSKLRAANAVGAMLFGLIGGFLGAIAFRRQRISPSAT